MRNEELRSNRRSFEADVARRAVRDAAGIKTFVNKAPQAEKNKQHKQLANNLNNSLLFNTNIHKPSMMLGKVLKCKSLEKRCTVAKASKHLPINHELFL